MYSGVSGLKTHQTKLDVIGNNIANVNTVAYKSSSVTFQEVLSQTVASAQPPTNSGTGGTNPSQVGLGTTIGAISTNHANGNIQTTDSITDLALDGGGFFVVSDGISNSYTRAGNFSIDSAGNLVTVNGEKVMGWNKGNQHLYAAYYSSVCDEVNITRVDEVYDIIDKDKSSVWALSEGQLEALCGEYLRRNYDNYVELISAGGSLSEADIFGGIENNSREILAQVTFETDSSQVESKLQRLLAYESDKSPTDIWFFGPKNLEENLPDQIGGADIADVYVPIETVYDQFKYDLGTEFIERLLDIELTPGSPNV